MITLPSDLSPTDVRVQERSDKIPDNSLVIVDLSLMTFQRLLYFFLPQIGHDTSLTMTGVINSAIDHLSHIVVHS